MSHSTLPKCNYRLFSTIYILFIYGIVRKRGDNMIIKTRSIEYKYMGLQMLYRRLPSEHAMKAVIHSKMKSAKAGIMGETKVAEVFDRYSFPFNCRILHDVSLSSNGKFQMDTVFISPYYIVILECKNIVGELCFETIPPCLTRTLENGKKEIFESPEVQVYRNMYLFKEWLHGRGIELPVKGVIVLSNMKSKVVKPPNHTDVIYASSIPVYLRNLPRDKKYLSSTQMDDLAQSIVAAHQAYFPYPMCKNWSIDPACLMTGVQCKGCEQFGMVKKNIGWICSNCGNIDRNAHVLTIQEWFTLIDDRISNKDCRKFLQINSSQLASRILNSMNLTREQKAKNTVYRWMW